jgi:hypothetical protein
MLKTLLAVGLRKEKPRDAIKHKTTENPDIDSHLFLLFQESHLSPKLRITISPHFLFSLKDKRGHYSWFAVCVESNKGEIGRSGVPYLPGV